MTWHHY